ncbi:Putative L-ascorbate oxidase [Klebsormidium nitens]|uniref:Putative L-ascorbate oxidase n=1 Tax=Klebsormidium nitens TaxID=105231 RepID=A0A1Y1HWA6_KLENI|nr:Putative L-ascorbate oxidase [Klebsormidium nitens]|eukprot:GAQ80786.1 Putative L-ascorbate oxidase [Klebsormidium nitens]
MACSVLPAAALLLGTLALLLAAQQATASYPPQVSGNTKEYNFTVSYAFWAPDCVERSIIVVNGQYPGPAIDVQRGDRVIVRVTNQLYAEGISIHWHGILQTGGSAYMDGSAYVSHCPILPHETFVYNFTVPDQVGTFWWHGHNAGHSSEGFYGSFVVRPNPAFGDTEPFQADGESMLLMNDWWHRSHQDQFIGLDIPQNPTSDFRFVGEPQSLLLNGRGQYNCSLLASVPAAYSAGDALNCSTTSPQCSPNTVIGPITPNSTHRLRIVNTGSLSFLNIAIEGHNMTVVAADANYVTPVSVKYLDVWAGQRYDVLITADQPVANYWITVTVRGRRPNTPPGRWALQYAGAPAGLPTTNASALAAQQPAWDNQNFTLAQQNLYTSLGGSNLTDPVAQNPTRQIVLVNSQNRVDGRKRNVLNGVAYVDPMTPITHTLFFNMTGGYTTGLISDQPPLTYNYIKTIGSPDNYTLATGQSVFEVNEGDVIDVVLQNGVTLVNASDPHPWHLHGMDFWVLGSAAGENFNGSTAKLNTVNPVYRSTVGLIAYGWTYIRFVASNPGPWFFHCHLISHMHMGMNTVINIKPASGVYPAPPPGSQMCGMVTPLVLQDFFLQGGRLK